METSKWYRIKGDTLTAIADAIRTKTGGTDSLTPEQMQSEIASIEASPDGNAITFGYVNQTVVSTAPDGKAFYNDVLRPTIPEDVLAEYPYAYMLNGDSFGAFAVKPYFYSSTSYPSTLKADGKGVTYTYDSESDSWVFQKEYTSTYIIISGFHWANYDIPNGSATATEIYFKGSEPVTEMVISGNIPAEREEAYAIASASLNELGAITQKMAGKKQLMTVADMVYWLNRVVYIPQGCAESNVVFVLDSAAGGRLPNVQRGIATSTISQIMTSGATGAVLEV